MGMNGLNSILNRAGLSHYIGKYPSDDMRRGFNFTEFSAIGAAFDEIYGSRGSRSTVMRAGRSIFSGVLCNFGALAGVKSPAFQELPVSVKLRIGLPALAVVLCQVSDQLSSVKERDQDYLFTVKRCLACWGRRGCEKPVCYLQTGLLQEGLMWITGGHNFRVIESKCAAAGYEVCEFTIQKFPIHHPGG